jgi:hypothetical protein
MPDDEKDQQQQQQTEQTPKGLTVPVPKRDEFFRNLRKAASPEDRPTDPDAPPANVATD